MGTKSHSVSLFMCLKAPCTTMARAHMVQCLEQPGPIQKQPNIFRMTGALPGPPCKTSFLVNVPHKIVTGKFPKTYVDFLGGPLLEPKLSDLGSQPCDMRAPLVQPASSNTLRPKLLQTEGFDREHKQKIIGLDTVGRIRIHFDRHQNKTDV